MPYGILDGPSPSIEGANDVLNAFIRIAPDGEIVIYAKTWKWAKAKKPHCR